MTTRKLDNNLEYIRVEEIVLHELIYEEDAA